MKTPRKSESPHTRGMFTDALLFVKLALAEPDARHLFSLSAVLLVLQCLHLLADGPLLIRLLFGFHLRRKKKPG
jgi:hypothetical protein